MAEFKNEFQAFIQANLEKKQADEARRATQINIANLLERLQADIDLYLSQFYEKRHQLRELLERRNQQFGGESLSILLMQMRPALEALAKMFVEHHSYLRAKLWHFIRSNVNQGTLPLNVFAELWRMFQQNLGGLAQQEPEFFVPFNMNLDENQVLTVSLDVDNPYMSVEDKQTFVDKYDADFQHVVTHSISGATISSGSLELDANHHLQLLANDGTRRPITAEELSEVKLILEQALQDHFAVEFKQVDSNPATEPEHASGPAPRQR